LFKQPHMLWQQLHFLWEVVLCTLMAILFISIEGSTT